MWGRDDTNSSRLFIAIHDSCPVNMCKCVNACSRPTTINLIESIVNVNYDLKLSMQKSVLTKDMKDTRHTKSVTFGVTIVTIVSQ